MFRFKCVSCEKWHEGMPTYGADAPFHYYRIPAEERETRCSLGTDECVIDEKWFYVRGCLEIPVHGEPERFAWGVWVSLSYASFEQFVRYFGEARRSHIGPFFGWLSAALPLYPDTENLKTRIHLRDNGIRPFIELEPTEHPLAVEQKNGVSVSRVAEIYAYFEHRDSQNERR